MVVGNPLKLLAQVVQMVKSCKILLFSLHHFKTRLKIPFLSCHFKRQNICVCLLKTRQHEQDLTLRQEKTDEDQLPVPGLYSHSLHFYEMRQDEM